MNGDYLAGIILNVTANEGELVIRLDSLFEADEEKENPVVELRVRGCHISQDELKMFNDYMLSEIEIYFEEENRQKYLNLVFDYYDNGELRIAYESYVKIDYAYNAEELGIKLKFLTQEHRRINKLYWKESRRHLDLIHKLERELIKEVDRAERKKEFFAGSEKEEKFEIQRQCYQRALDLLNQFIAEGRD